MRVYARSARALTVSVPKRSHVCLELVAVDSPAWSTCQQQCADVARACTIFLQLGESFAYGAATRAETAHTQKRLVIHTCADTLCALVGSVHFHIGKLIYTPALTHVYMSH
jgi:hypothetical protein